MQIPESSQFFSSFLEFVFSGFGQVISKKRGTTLTYLFCQKIHPPYHALIWSAFGHPVDNCHTYYLKYLSKVAPEAEKWGRTCCSAKILTEFLFTSTAALLSTTPTKTCENLNFVKNFGSTKCSASSFKFWCDFKWTIKSISVTAVRGQKSQLVLMVLIKVKWFNAIEKGITQINIFLKF